MNYYLEEIPQNQNDYVSAIGKARTDIFTICKQKEYCALKLDLDFVPREKDPLFRKLQQHYDVYKQWKAAIKNMKKGDRILIQYPILSYSVLLINVLKRCRRKGIKVICLVHDLETLRIGHSRKRDFRKKAKIYMQEIKLLEACSYLIVHNSEMKKYLYGKGISKDKMVCLQVFDYLCEMPIRQVRCTKEICIAGNLTPQKAGYLYKLDSVLCTFHLYGNGIDKNYAKHAEWLCRQYKGVYKPEELPLCMEGAYGLVWDGEDITTCSGIYGQYEKYNNPHKFSLYLAAGLPVIVWKYAAIAKMVIEMKLGIVISSLEEIPDKISAVSEGEYADMLANVEKVGKQIRKGFFLKRALEKIDEMEQEYIQK